jgi:small-conductance mechanosensitive channel
MELTQLLERIILSLNGFEIRMGQLLAIVLAMLLFGVIGWASTRRMLPRIFWGDRADLQAQRRAAFLINSVLVLGLVIIILRVLELDYLVYDRTPDSELPVANDILLTNLVRSILVIQLARLVDWALELFLRRRFEAEEASNKSSGGFYSMTVSRTSDYQISSVVRPVVFLLAVIYIVQDLGLNTELFPIGKKEIEGETVQIWVQLTQILWTVFGLALIRLLVWATTNIFLKRYYQRSQVDLGSRYAINRLLSYFLYVIGALIVLESVGVELSLIWGGAAALLVGVGLGLQQTFNDLICGVILLFERTVDVGDVVDMQGLVGTVRRIGTRTSLVETRDNITVIVPNSKLVGENVVNWSHFERKARFHVTVGVAYGSDTELVRNILTEEAEEHKKILSSPKPFVRFKDFGDSALVFEVHFWTRDFIPIEDTKSDLRFAIDRRFRESGVKIPFPQRDLWVRNPEDLRPPPKG